MEHKNFKLIFSCICFFIFGVTAGVFGTSTYDAIQGQKEKNSKVTADECRTIFNDFVEEYNIEWNLDESFEADFGYYIELSQMTSDEYYTYLEEMYQNIKAQEEAYETGMPMKQRIVVSKSKKENGEYEYTYSDIDTENTFKIYKNTDEENNTN